MTAHLNKTSGSTQYDGTKLPSNLDNPFDSLMMYFGEKSLPMLKYLNFTPNILTLIGGMFVIFSIALIGSTVWMDNMHDIMVLHPRVVKNWTILSMQSEMF